MSKDSKEPVGVEIKNTISTETPTADLTLEERGARASKEIGQILKKYELALAVNIEGAQAFISSLKPTLIEGRKGAEEKEAVPSDD